MDFCCAEVSLFAYKPLAPWPTRAGVFGMQRTMGNGPPHQFDKLFKLMPAATDIIKGFLFCSADCNGAKTDSITCGLTAKITTSA